MFHINYFRIFNATESRNKGFVFFAERYTSTNHWPIIKY